MSLAVGFQCRDGVVIAADTLYSGRTFPTGPKAWLITDKAEKYGFVIAGAGPGPALWSVKDLCKDATWKRPTKRSIADAVESQLVAFYQRHKATLRDEALEFLVAIRGSDGAQLYLSENSPVLGPVDSYACIGSNGSILASWIARRGIVINGPLVNAKLLAAYIVLEVIGFDTEVGGEITLATMRAGPVAGKPLMEVVPEAMLHQVSAFEDIARPAIKMAAAMLDRTVPDAVVVDWLQKYVRDVLKARKEFMDAPLTGED